MTKKQTTKTKKKKSSSENATPETVAPVAQLKQKLSPPARKSLLPKDLFREIEELKRRVAELEQKVV